MILSAAFEDAETQAIYVSLLLQTAVRVNGALVVVIGSIVLCFLLYWRPQSAYPSSGKRQIAFHVLRSNNL